MADQGSEGLLSPLLRQKRFNAVKPYLYGRVLDFGCGSGGLAEFVSSDSYLGVEIDEFSLKTAKNRFPSHRFVSELPDTDEKFDTIILLAVIEHVKDPSALLNKLTKYMSSDPKARIAVTTPHPSVDWVHDLGASLGLFSKHANEEHEELLDKRKLKLAGEKTGLRLLTHKSFLFGANQLAIYGKNPT